MARRKLQQHAAPPSYDAILYQIGRLDSEISLNCSEYLRADKARDWEGVRVALKRGTGLWAEREQLKRQLRGY